ncbi:MAG: ABC transporter substrate-binding protein [Carbonactinosporaceae bacterium]
MSRQLIAACAAAALLAAGCGGSPSSPSQAGGGSGGGAKTNEAYQELMKLPQDELVKRAKDEGEVTLYTSMETSVSDDVEGAFEDAYDIDVNLYRASSETVLQRVLQESQAGFPGSDLVETNSTEMSALQQEGVFTPYTRAPRDGVIEQGKFDTWTSTRLNVFAPSWNTKLVKPGDEPKSWDDLADPKWKGKLSMEAEDYDWYMALHDWYLSEGKSEKETQALFNQMADNAKIVKGHSAQAEMLPAGRFSVVASNYTYITQGTMDDGADVDYKPLIEPVVVRPNGAGLMKTAKHPAAATLFIEWLLTDGQEVLMDLHMDPSVQSQHGTLEGVDKVWVDVAKLLEENEKWSTRYDQLLR